MKANIDKTFFLHCAKNPRKQSLNIPNHGRISHQEEISSIYLGIHLIASNDLLKHMKYNFTTKKYNINKYLQWLDANEDVPIKYKLLVMDNCMWPAILYSCENWWLIEQFSELMHHK